MDKKFPAWAMASTRRNLKQTNMSTISTGTAVGTGRAIALVSINGRLRVMYI